MNKAQIAFQQFEKTWEELITYVSTNRPNEMDIGQFGYENIKLSEIALPWAGWKSVIESDFDPSDILYEKKLTDLFTTLTNRLNEAKNNGIAWLLNSSPFFLEVTEVSQVCFVLVPTVRATKLAMEEADVRGVKIAAHELLDQNKALQSSVEEAKAQTKEIAEYADQVEDVKTILALATKNLEDTTAQLARSRADLNKQGLSGAFSAAASQFNCQRAIFGFIFGLALLGLFIIGLVTADNFKSLGQDFKFLSSITLAAPFVWLGWFSARQMSQLTRVQQDYEYKKATALAFEAHKVEVSSLDVDGKELSTRLLETVIKNFGDNPVRLLPEANKDHGHPMEELLSKLTDEKVVNNLIKSLEVWKKS